MEQSRLERWNELEAAKNAAISILSTSTEAQRIYKPSAESWSMIQVIQHILFSEGGTLGYMVKKTSSGWEVLDRVGEEQIANGSLLVNRLASGEKYKAPAVLPEPDGEESLESLEKRWNSLREQYAQFLNQLPIEFDDRLVFKQPAAGMLTLHYALDFLTEHIKHHLPQLETLKSSQTAI